MIFSSLYNHFMYVFLDSITFHNNHTPAIEGNRINTSVFGHFSQLQHFTTNIKKGKSEQNYISIPLYITRMRSQFKHDSIPRYKSYRILQISFHIITFYIFLTYKITIQAFHKRNHMSEILWPFKVYCWINRSATIFARKFRMSSCKKCIGLSYTLYKSKTIAKMPQS